jgi:hypothetical protein
VNGLSFLSIDVDESIWLEREFEEKDVWDVVRVMNGDKAPGGVQTASQWLSFVSVGKY